MIRHCPLLSRPGPSRRLDLAPAPWEVRECLETGLVFLANPPAQERFMEEFAWQVTHAEESRRRRREEPFVAAVSRAAKRFRQRWLKRDKLVGIVCEIVQRRPNGPIHLVDVGCANGGLFGRLMDRLPDTVARRIEPVGIEISTQLAGQADAKLQQFGGHCIHAAGVAGLKRLPATSIDVIILSCVLEHEIDPVALLDGCRERLAPDGVVVVKVPNYACFSRRLRRRRWCGYRWPDHVNYFTPRSLTAAATLASLRVTRMGWLDRSPLSDSLYSVLGHACTAPRLARAS